MIPRRISPVPRLLRDHAAEVRAQVISDHAEDFSVKRWDEKFPNDPAVQGVLQRFPAGSITRSDLGLLGSAARLGQQAAQRQLLIGTLMWGYGTQGGRSYRNGATALSSPVVTTVLGAVSQAVGHRRSVPDGYESFVTHKIAGYGEGFFTKYLYFLAFSDTGWPSDQAKPLIMDQRVLASLGFIRDFLGADWGNPQRRPAVERYLRYCETLTSWANGIQCRPDQVERFLFRQENSWWFDSRRLLRPLVRAAIDSVDDGTASGKLTAEVNGLPLDLVKSVRLGPF